MLVLVLLASAISFRVSAITIIPGTYLSVGNEDYTVNQTMDFESITIDSSYIVFNNMGFYVSSGNDITITLVYINDDIAGAAANGEKVLEFYADTTAGSVVFDLSGFPAGNEYEVKRSGSSISTRTASGSGFISFDNDVPGNQLFEIFQEGEGVVNNPPASLPSSPPMNNDEQEIISEQNNPPDTPVKPSGPTFVEVGVEYMYMSSAVDVDGDQISFRFDWGDGNYSDWSDFTLSNTSVSMSHSRASISTFGVRVIAQDKNGLISSWSSPLNVTVLQADLGGEPPVADFEMPSNVSVNQTIVFDASDSFDEDGVIVSYYWDFGDGENGSSMIADHIYENPGEYTVTLVVTDNNGNTFSKSLIVAVASEVEEESKDKQGVIPFYPGIVIFGCTIAILVCLAIFFRGNIKSFLSAHHVRLFSHARIFDRNNKIKKIDDKIEKIKR